MSTYLWQNFLKDSSIIAFISDAIQKLYHTSGADVLVEIWPWKWAITKKIKRISPSFFVVEKDITMKDHLMSIGLEESQITFWDVLETDIVWLLYNIWKTENQALVVWNLPYYITSPIFKHLFWKENPELLGWFFMIQDEVGQKIKSDAQKKSYLRWLVNRAYRVDYVKMVPAKCFSPAPKVKSCLVRFTKKDKTEAIDPNKLEEFLNLFSPYSRKTLWKISKMNEKKWKTWFSIPSELQGKRLEELDWESLRVIL